MSPLNPKLYSGFPPSSLQWPTDLRDLATIFFFRPNLSFSFQASFINHTVLLGVLHTQRVLPTQSFIVPFLGALSPKYPHVSLHSLSQVFAKMSVSQGGIP